MSESFKKAWERVGEIADRDQTDRSRSDESIRRAVEELDPQDMQRLRRALDVAHEVVTAKRFAETQEQYEERRTRERSEVGSGTRYSGETKS